MGRGGAAFELQNSQATVAERRALRGSYRQLHTAALEGKENLINGGTALQELLQKANALHSKVSRPREHAADAEVVAQLAECGLSMIKRGQAIDQGRTPADLTRALRLAFGAEPLSGGAGVGIDWCGLGAEASRLHRPAPGVGCLLGPLAAEAKARKAPAARQAKRGAAGADAAVRPQELEAIDEANNKQETDRNFETMWRALKQAVGFGDAAGAVSLPALVCSHGSFAQTVENIFCLSFLVRDNRVRLLADADAGLSVQPVSEQQRAAAAGGQGGSRVQQFMLNFTMEDWDIMKLLVPPSECLMPHRGGSAGGSAGAGPSSRAGAGSSAGAARQQSVAKRARRQ